MPVAVVTDTLRSFEIFTPAQPKPVAQMGSRAIHRFVDATRTLRRAANPAEYVGFGGAPLVVELLHRVGGFALDSSVTQQAFWGSGHARASSLPPPAPKCAFSARWPMFGEPLLYVSLGRGKGHLGVRQL